MFPVRKPKSANAAATLVMLGVLSIIMFMSVTILALVTKVKVAEFDADLIGLPASEDQKTVIAQIAQAVFSNFPPMFIYVSTVTALILVLAANTAFNGFPVLGSILAQDNYTFASICCRGDRLAFSNGIVTLAFMAILLVVVFQGQCHGTDSAVHRGRIPQFHAESVGHDPALDGAAQAGG